MSKWTKNSAQENYSLVASIEYDLAAEAPSTYVGSPDLLRYSNVAVEITTTSATGTSGNVILHETNAKGSHTDRNYDTSQTVALGVNTSNYTKVSNFMSQYLMLQFPTSLGSTGSILVTITAKT